MLILVVEDEFLINLTASDELVRAGHQVMSAYDADHAIRLLEKFPGIELVFTDIDMPGSMDGLRLAAAVRKRWPPVHLIITSGKRQPTRDDLPTGGTFIAKPYMSGGLVDAVEAFA
jgi:two-component system, response regulator PdtaR